MSFMDNHSQDIKGGMYLADALMGYFPNGSILFWCLGKLTRKRRFVLICYSYHLCYCTNALTEKFKKDEFDVKQNQMSRPNIYNRDLVLCAGT